MHCRRREHWNQDRINVRAQRRAAEQKGIRQETRQEEVTGEVETARAAALLQTATKSRAQSLLLLSHLSGNVKPWNLASL